MRVLVLGAYGLIGAEVVRRLLADGVNVVGFGRSIAKGRRFFPEIDWRAGDLRTLTTVDDWAPLLGSIDAVVNASGALQDGAKDTLALSQDKSICSCIEVCARTGIKKFVQISAPGAVADATTEFMRTKANADAALRASGLNWTILKPGLVISAYAYGGTALIRMLAAFPWVQPLMSARARLQTVAAGDVAEAVALALTTERMARLDVDLVEGQSHTLGEIVAAFRAWLGFSPAYAVLETPRLVGAFVARCADLAAWLGWRSPLRTTALSVLAGNVLGDAAAGERALGRPLKSLGESLRALPSTAQERVFARAQLVFPALLMVLSGFWIASGVIALLHGDAAASVLRGTPLANDAEAFVMSGALLDIAIGVGLCVRATVRMAALAAVMLSAIYLAIGSVVTPELWADPLGPFVKVIPGIALALVVLALAEER
jgi:uncharacterized protein YbjT (DUF2867 family)